MRYAVALIFAANCANVTQTATETKPDACAEKKARAESATQTNRTNKILIGVGDGGYVPQSGNPYKDIADATGRELILTYLAYEADFTCWRAALERGENIVAENNRLIQKALDGLTGVNDIAFVGASRAGWAALHYTYGKNYPVVLLYPVITLSELAEFKGMDAQDSDIRKKCKLDMWAGYSSFDDRVNGSLTAEICGQKVDYLNHAHKITNDAIQGAGDWLRGI